MASLIPTLFIIFLGMGKELYLEIKRWKGDKLINEAPILVVTNVDESGKTSSEER